MLVADYDIIIDGELPAGFASTFAPHDFVSDHGATTIRVKRVDNAALLALLGRISALALVLIRVERLPDSSRLPRSERITPAG